MKWVHLTDIYMGSLLISEEEYPMAQFPDRPYDSKAVWEG